MVAAYVLVGLVASVLAGQASATVYIGCCTARTSTPILSQTLCVPAINAACGTDVSIGLLGASVTGFVQGGYCSNNVCVKGSGSVTSDPVFTGFDNTTFEFFGSPGSNYTVLTSEALTVNMGLVEAGPQHIRHQDGEGTFVGSLAVLSSAFELIAHVSEAGNMSFTLNGTDMDITSPGAWDAVNYEPYAPGIGQVITLSQSPFKLTIVAVKQFHDEVSGYNRGHFDLSVDIMEPVQSVVKGVLGQTLDSSTNPADSTYQIPSLTYRSSSILAVSASRRLLAIGRELQFPLHARLSSAKIDA